MQQNNFNALPTEQQNKHNFNMKSLNLLSVLVLTLFINGCSDKNDIEDKIIQQTIDAIKITEEEVTLNIGDSHTLTIKHSPENLPFLNIFGHPPIKTLHQLMPMEKLKHCLSVLLLLLLKPKISVLSPPVR